MFFLSLKLSNDHFGHASFRQRKYQNGRKRLRSVQYVGIKIYNTTCLAQSRNADLLANIHRFLKMNVVTTGALIETKFPKKCKVTAEDARLC